MLPSNRTHLRSSSGQSHAGRRRAFRTNTCPLDSPPLLSVICTLYLGGIDTSSWNSGLLAGSVNTSLGTVANPLTLSLALLGPGQVYPAGAAPLAAEYAAAEGNACCNYSAPPDPPDPATFAVWIPGGTGFQFFPMLWVNTQTGRRNFDLWVETGGGWNLVGRFSRPDSATPTSSIGTYTPRLGAVATTAGGANLSTLIVELPH